jgi:hypothetical protein
MERGTRLSPVITRAKQLAESGIRCWHGAMTEYPQAYQRLRHYIAERMRVSHIYQPMMLMELLGRSSPAPALAITWPQRDFA